MARGRLEKRDSKSKNKKRSKSRNKKACYYCKKEGHFIKECPERKKKNNGKYNDESDIAVVADGYESAEVLSISTEKHSEEWILESGCSFHMTPNLEWFSSYKEIDGGKVLVGNNMACNVIGIGTVKLKMQDGSVKLLLDVRHVPELKRNLLSLGILDQSGCSFKGEGGTLKVFKGSLQIMKGTRQNDLYKLQGNIILNSACLVSISEPNASKLWHYRLGHVSEKGLEELHKQGLIDNGNYQKLSFCEHCVYGNQKRVSFHNATHTTQGILDYVHSDVWGPAKVLSLGGAKYFITFIDDWSRKVWTYLLKHKNQAFKCFKQWKLLVENQTGRHVKLLRTDNGLEYLSEEFNEFCKDNGIRRHKTVRLTP